MPSEVPAKSTPWVLDGEVSEIVQIGNLMVAGGKFRQVRDPMRGATYAQRDLFAFDATTGLVSQTFRPRLNGRVRQLLPGPTADTVYVAGEFTKINNRGPQHLQLISISTGEAMSWFSPPSTNGRINTMELLPHDRLFIGGSFTKLDGVSRGQLATLDATTGAFDPFLSLKLSGRHNNTGSGARAPVGARESAVTPAGDRLVVTGNFRKADGRPRAQIVMLKLTGRTAAVATDWDTKRYGPICHSGAFDSYMRDVAMSPDGSYFVVTTTGGATKGSLCDTAARFETHAKGTALSPTWTSMPGGDTLWGVEVTPSAVYVGGHQRWLNNPSGAGRAGAGAVPRPGLAALDPRSGIPLDWNPGRNPRGEAAYDIYETDAGVWVVSDTEWIGNRRYHRSRIAFFPYSEGGLLASDDTGSLPGHVYVGPARSSGAHGSAATARVIGFTGTRVTSKTKAAMGGLGWNRVRGAVLIGSRLFYGHADAFLYRRSFDGVSFGRPIRVDPYRDRSWSQVMTGSRPPGQTYAGRLPTWYHQLPRVTGMFYSRGRMFYSLAGHRSLYWRWFSPDSGVIGGTEHTVRHGKVDWSTSRGMFVSGRSLYFVSSATGHLKRTRFARGRPVGRASVVNRTTDWRGSVLFLMSRSSGGSRARGGDLGAGRHPR
jgi:hypothetical protein